MPFRSISHCGRDWKRTALRVRRNKSSYCNNLSKPGDEVLVSSFTFSASVNPIVYLGATPVLIDSEQEIWNMSPELLEEAIKDRISKGKMPKAIVPIHLYNMPAKMDEIIEIAY